MKRYLALGLLVLGALTALGGCNTPESSPADTWWPENDHFWDTHDSRPPGWYEMYESHSEDSGAGPRPAPAQ
jgi:hypothetical protein